MPDQPFTPNQPFTPINLPFVEKPTFTIGHFHKEGLEVKSFDPVTTACYLRDWQVDECCALFLGWRYDQKEETYTDSKGREQSCWWEAWLNPKGKGTYRLGLDEVKPPKFRTSKWTQVLSLCVEMGWEPKLEIHVDSGGKRLHTCTLNLLTQVPACERKGDAVCKAFLAAAWTLQEAKGEGIQMEEEGIQMEEALVILGPQRPLTAQEIQDAHDLDMTGVEELLRTE